MQFSLVENAELTPNGMYFTAKAWDVDRDGVLRKNKQPSGPYKFVRIHDSVAEMRARGQEPMSFPPPTAVFEYTDENGQPATFELSYRQSNYVAPAYDPVRPSESSGITDPKFSFGGRKKRKFTSSSRARRRSKTRKSHRGAGGGR